jgi:peptidyl-prolyl cis-trans isomerase C
MPRSRRSTLLSLVALIGVALLSAGTVAACGSSSGASPSPTADRVVAVVNGHPLHDSDVQVVRAEKRFLGTSDSSAPALKEAIDRQLLRREAARLGTSAARETVRKRVTELTTQLGGSAALEAALKRADMSRAQLQQTIEDGLLREAVQAAEFPSIHAGEQAAQAYFRRHRKDVFTQAASVHLGVFPVRVELVAENAIGRLRQGRPFAEVAHQFSIDPESRDQGGDQGWVYLASLPGPLKAAVGSAGHGLLAKPIPALGVWYVVEVLGKRPASVLPFANVRARLVGELTRVKRSKALEAWLANARHDASIERK